MAKNDDIKKIDAEIKALKEQMNREIDRNNDIIYKYWDMEGMYGKKAFSVWDEGQGMRGFHYEYPSDEIRSKENKEREQFLIDNNWMHESEIRRKYNEMMLPLKERKCMLKFGMTLAEKEKQDKIKRVEENILALEKELEERKQYLATLKAE